MNRWVTPYTGIDDIITTEIDGGDVRVRLGDATKNTGIDFDASMFGLDGFASVPNDATSDGAADCFYFVEGNRKVVLGTRDRRYLEKTGSLKPGDRVIYSKGAARILLKDADDYIGIYTETPTGTSMIGEWDGSAGRIMLKVGLTGIEITETEISIGINGGPFIKLSALLQSIVMQGNAVNVDGGFVTLGVNSDGTRPVKFGIENIIIGPLGMLGIPSIKVLAASY